MSRRLAGLACALALASASGCFALEEIDRGQEYLDEHADVSKRKPARSEQEAEADAEKPGIVERLRGWWARRQEEPATAKARDDGPPPHPDDLPGRCELGGSTQFMRKFDCQLRGGRYTPLSESARR